MRYSKLSPGLLEPEDFDLVLVIDQILSCEEFDHFTELKASTSTTLIAGSDELLVEPGQLSWRVPKDEASGPMGMERFVHGQNIYCKARRLNRSFYARDYEHWKGGMWYLTGIYDHMPDLPALRKEHNAAAGIPRVRLNPGSLHLNPLNHSYLTTITANERRFELHLWAGEDDRLNSDTMARANHFLNHSDDIVNIICDHIGATLFADCADAQLSTELAHSLTLLQVFLERSQCLRMVFDCPDHICSKRTASVTGTDTAAADALAHHAAVRGVTADISGHEIEFTLNTMINYCRIALRDQNFITECYAPDVLRPLIEPLAAARPANDAR